MEALDTTGAENPAYHSQTAGKGVQLVVWGTGARGTNFISYTAAGVARSQVLKLNSHCISCHSSINSATQPFGDGKTPRAYAWDSSNIGDRYSDTGTTAWGKFNFSGGTTPVGGTNAKNTVSKAFSAHGNAANNVMGWNTATGTDSGTITNISAGVNVLCFDCHNSHGSSATGITSQYSSATGRNKGGLLKDVTAGLGGYAATYTPASGGSTATKNAYSPGAAICFDCHNTRTADTTRPWGYNSTYSATQALNGYWDTPYFGNYTVPVAKRTTYKLGTAGAKAKPAGGHFGTSVTGSPVSNITKQNHATTVSTGINGLCTPCHDPHGVSKNTAYLASQQYGVPLLKGTWVTSPYKEDKADIAVQRGGGSRVSPVSNGGAIPGYHIDQNTLIVQPNPTGSGGAVATGSAKSDVRSQKFAPFTNSANTLQTIADSNFAGLCTQCHAKANLTNATAPAASNWKTKERIHQSVKGWAAATGSNASNQVHAYTCSKCHAPHVSRLPRLMVTNCLDVNHYKQVATGGTIPATASSSASGNLSKPGSSGGIGRFPTGGNLVMNATAWPSAYNPGPWWFQQATVSGGSITFATNCHNAANAGGTAYNPTNQKWNTRTSW